MKIFRKIGAVLTGGLLAATLVPTEAASAATCYPQTVWSKRGHNYESKSLNTYAVHYEQLFGRRCGSRDQVTGMRLGFLPNLLYNKTLDCRYMVKVRFNPLPVFGSNVGNRYVTCKKGGNSVYVDLVDRTYAYGAGDRTFSTHVEVIKDADFNPEFETIMQRVK